MDNSELFGKSIRVNIAKPQMNKKKAVWEEADEWFKALKDAEALEDEEEGKANVEQSLRPSTS